MGDRKRRLRGWMYAHPKVQGAYRTRGRWLTGPFRMLPDFVFIGAQKCGIVVATMKV